MNCQIKKVCYNKLIISKNNYNYGILPNLSKNIPILKNYFINSKAELYNVLYTK